MPELVNQGSAYVHPDDGRVCYVCRHWVGNQRDGHWQEGRWYLGSGGWRYCGTLESHRHA